MAANPWFLWPQFNVSTSVTGVLLPSYIAEGQWVEKCY